MVAPRLRGFVITRLLLMIPSVLILLTVVFLIMHILPGDPALALYGDTGTPADIAALRHSLGLDKPVYVQYLDYLSQVVRGDFGMTVTSERISNRIFQTLGPTLELTIAGMIVGLVIAIPGGVYAAMKRGTVIDQAIVGLALLGFSFPLFFLAMIIQYGLGVSLKLLPPAGMVDPLVRPQYVTGLPVLDGILTGNLVGAVNAFLHLILPALTMGIFVVAPILSLTRQNTIQALQEDFIVTCRALGLPEGSTVYGHGLRNALLPVVTFVGLRIAAALGGSIYIESVFSRPGLGQLLVQGINLRDFNQIQAVMIYYAIIVAVVSTIVDILYGVIDPRVTYE